MITIQIGKEEFKYWSNLSISLNYSGVASSFSFKAPYVAIKPLGYQSVRIYYNNNILLTGNIINYKASDDNTPSIYDYSGYSTGGILQEVTLPSDQVVEFNGMKLKEIVEKIISPFGINLVMKAENEIYDKLEFEKTDTVANILVKICEQRNLRLTHDELGSIVIEKPTNRGIQTIFNDNNKAKKSILSINGQGVFSEYIAMKQAGIDDNVEAEAKEVFNINTYRPTISIQKDGAQGDIGKFANAMLRNGGKSFLLELELEDWHSFKNDLYKTGDLIKYSNSELGLNNQYLWAIDNITYTDDKLEMAMLKLYPAWVMYDSIKPSNPVT